MDARQEFLEFLTSRPTKLKAAAVGLADYGARRVPDLRPEDLNDRHDTLAATR